MKLRPKTCAALIAPTLALCLASCTITDIIGTPRNYMGLSTSAPITAQEKQTLLLAQARWPATSGNCTAPEPGIMIDCALMPLGALTLAAATGSRHAQLELGRRFETGRGVPLDFERAEDLYDRAATTTGGPIWIWVPGVGDAPGQTMQVDTPYNYGLPEAAQARAALRERLAIADGAPETSSEDAAP